MSIRSIFPLTKSPSPSSSPRWSSGAERSVPNPTSNRRGTSASGDSASERTNPLEVAAQALAELGRLDRAKVEPDTGAESLVEAALEECNCGLHGLGTDPLDPEFLREPRVERVESLVSDLAAQKGVRFRVDRLRVDDPLEQPGGGTVEEALELGGAEHGPAAELVENDRASELGVPFECAQGPPEPA